MLLLNNQFIAKHVAGYHFLNPSLVFRTFLLAAVYAILMVLVLVSPLRIFSFVFEMLQVNINVTAF